MNLEDVKSHAGNHGIVKKYTEVHAERIGIRKRFHIFVAKGQTGVIRPYL